MPQALPVPDEDTCYIACNQFRATLASNAEDDSLNFARYLAEHLGGKALVSSPNPTQDEIQQTLRMAQGAKKVIIGTYNGHLNPGQLELVRAFAAEYSQVAVFALRNPYDLKELPETVCGVAAYEYTRCCFDAIIQLLRGELSPRGRLPILM